MDAFVLLLLAALVASALLGLAQQAGYRRAAAGLQAAHAGAEGYLVSGRSRGVLRGAVVLLVVDGRREEVLDARVMAGASVFARFRRRPALHGPLATIAFRERDRAVLRALEEAEASFRALRASRERRARRAASTAPVG